MALPLLRRPLLLLGASFLLYAAARATGLNFQSWIAGEVWFFDPFAWQFLFMIGAVLSYAPPRWPRLRWPFDALSVAILTAGVAVIWGIDQHPRLLAAMPGLVIRYVITQDKTGLHPFRLLSILALTWLVARTVPRGVAWLGSRWAAPFVLTGQNSLPVFCFGIFIGFIARLGLEYDDGAAMQVGVNVCGAAAMVAVGALSAWYRAKGRSASVRPAALQAMARTDSG
ncbi:MAG TPA: OpgC domain-containing protein, partial [Acetobacteraceae bacterium]